MHQEYRNKKHTGLVEAVMWKILTGLKAAHVLLPSDVWKRVQASKERWLLPQLKVLLIWLLKGVSRGQLQGRPEGKITGMLKGGDWNGNDFIL